MSIPAAFHGTVRRIVISWSRETTLALNKRAKVFD